MIEAGLMESTTEQAAGTSTYVVQMRAEHGVWVDVLTVELPKRGRRQQAVREALKAKPDLAPEVGEDRKEFRAIPLEIAEPIMVAAEAREPRIVIGGE